MSPKLHPRIDEFYTQLIEAMEGIEGVAQVEAVESPNAVSGVQHYTVFFVDDTWINLVVHAIPDNLPPP